MLDPHILRAYNQKRKVANRDFFCHAPLTSINFEQNGNATVCCYNRTYVLGRWPEQDLQEMWTGEAAKAIRKEMMRSQALPKGCDLCAEQLSSGNHEGLKARLYDQYAEQRYPVQNGDFVVMPKVMEFELSNVCNLECSMCNGYFSSTIRKNREHLDPLPNPYTSDFVEQLAPFIPHLQEVKFLGGEPFLIDIYYEIWELIAQMKPDLEVHITTNGTVLNQRVRRLLERMNVDIILSIDSLNPQTYESIRKNAVFARVRENLDWFLEYTRSKGNTLNFAVCPMQNNWQDMPELVAYCNEVGANVYFNTVYFPEEESLRNLSYPKLGEVLESWEKHDFVQKTEQQIRNNQLWNSLKQQVRAWQEQTRADYELELQEKETMGRQLALYQQKSEGLSPGSQYLVWTWFCQQFPLLQKVESGREERTPDNLEALEALEIMGKILEDLGDISLSEDFELKIDRLRQVVMEAGMAVNMGAPMLRSRGNELIANLNAVPLESVAQRFRQHFAQGDSFV